MLYHCPLNTNICLYPNDKNIIAACKFFSPALLVFHRSLSDSNNSITVLRIFADFSCAVVWMVLISSSPSLFSRFSGTLPRAPTYTLWSRKTAKSTDKFSSYVKQFFFLWIIILIDIFLNLLSWFFLLPLTQVISM